MRRCLEELEGMVEDFEGIWEGAKRKNCFED
jgi:hypothetical protein